MSHLGERVSALIDGELGHRDRERALAHLTFCADCRAEVDAMRALKSRLRSIEPPTMPADLGMSLLRMSEPGGPIPPRMRPFPDHPAFAATRLPSMGISPTDNRPRLAGGHSGPGRSSRTRRAGYVAVGFASAAVALGTMFIVGGTGGQQTPNPPVQFVNPQQRIAPPQTSPTPSPSSSLRNHLAR
ncbi:anti-sigma factor family protein [Microtetraspora malaysiensis]|uniref:Anti-sigma factor family protein n=1 Tax=Microtetraspora malaysiensis TaxID=161358 RepID=A0ABW6SJY0_9ACTN